MTRRTATGAGLAALVAVLWAHGLVLGAHGLVPPPLLGPRLDTAAALLGGAAGAVVLVALAALAAGTEEPGPAVLIAPLLTALSPAFARSAAAGGTEVLLAALLIAGSARAFAETHASGRLPLSAALFGAAAGLGPVGAAALAAVFLQKLVFTRRFRLGAEVYRFAIIWLAIALAVWAGLRLLGVAGPRGAAGPAAGGEAIGLVRLLAALWRETDGLAVFPFLLVLLLGWKPKGTFFVLTLAGLLLAAWLAASAGAPAAEVPRTLAPALPFAFLVVGEALRAAAAVFESSGLGGRGRAILGGLVVAALGLGQAWPTLALVAGR